MSILNRLGWANRTILGEGRIYDDELKKRIMNLFDRDTLGKSKNYAVDKIADIIRREKGEEVDINDVADEDIIKIAYSEEITNGKFEPKLKSSIADARQESEGEISELEDGGLPSDGDMSNSMEDSAESEMDSEELDSDSSDFEEDAEECKCKQQRPKDEEDMSTYMENIKPSAKQVKQLLQENYIKSRQHKFKQEERYRMY
jgi:hypothetical protein